MTNVAAVPDQYTYDPTGWRDRLIIYAFVFVPLLALIAAGFVAWGGWLNWHDAVIAILFFWVTRIGIGVGYHRLFTHGSFKAVRGVKIALAIAGSLALEGPPTVWVADHRKHHQHSDQEGDPHSPWRFGETPWALTKGFLFAHMGWILKRQPTNVRRYAPDLLKDPDLVRISGLFPLFVVLSLFLPPIIGGLWSWSWQGALTAFFWATLVRIALMHHITWCVNSVCHVVSNRPFSARDKSANVGWLAIPTGGESWHNLHHAEPTSARHGVGRFQLDEHARIIWLLEQLGWATQVRWPNPERLAKLRVPA